MAMYIKLKIDLGHKEKSVNQSVVIKKFTQKSMSVKPVISCYRSTSLCRYAQGQECQYMDKIENASPDSIKLNPPL